VQRQTEPAFWLNSPTVRPLPATAKNADAHKRAGENLVAYKVKKGVRDKGMHAILIKLQKKGGAFDQQRI
jgi:hypothetical protein